MAVEPPVRNSVVMSDGLTCASRSVPEMTSAIFRTASSIVAFEAGSGHRQAQPLVRQAISIAVSARSVSSILARSIFDASKCPCLCLTMSIIRSTSSGRAAS